LIAARVRRHTARIVVVKVTAKGPKFQGSAVCNDLIERNDVHDVSFFRSPLPDIAANEGGDLSGRWNIEAAAAENNRV
jgi:hypothetical protein